MSETPAKDEEFLVRVQAQVMTRDDSSGGWVPMGGGGLSNVGLRRLVKTNGEDHTRNEYLIQGERIADKSVVLDCILKRDIRYTKANPKFHHWQTDDKRFGLTFERSDDAKAFDRGIRRARADLVEGVCNTDGDEEVFVLLDLPMSGQSSQSASTTSTTTSSPTPQSPESTISGLPESFQFSPHANHGHLHRVHYIPTTSPHRNVMSSNVNKPSSPPSDKSSSSKSDTIDTSSFSRDDIWIKPDDPTSLSSKSDQVLIDCSDNLEMKDYQYVIFAKSKQQHEYSYPTLESVQKPPSKRESTSNIKRQPLIQPIAGPPLPRKQKDKKTTQRLIPQQKSRCKHCHDLFSHEENGRGSCEDAPDGVEKCIECITCVWCPKCIIYHTMSDPEGDYGHPCMCDTTDDSNCKKWTALTILSLFVPCLWCYWPLMACHKCGVACGCCGGRHKAA
ncbi:sprouty-related, EVH1 domain-containing protein 2-like [Argopecten irradians]|uniref:sprouty-related, EVH1 domain-containing protein 2-like n=1 Tax=Argopecten irradians TaxID=31199 RepID=UPI003710412C